MAPTESFNDDLEKSSTNHGSILGHLPTLSHDPGAANKDLKLTRVGRNRSVQIESTNSINIGTGPSRPTAGVALPGLYRTLSIHVEETNDGSVHRDPTNKPTKDVTEIATIEWHLLPGDDVLSRLGVSPSIGLDALQIGRRLKQHGRNVISPPRKNWARKPAPANLALAIVLLVVILIQASFNAWQDWSTGRVMASISGLVGSDALVVRDGKTERVEASVLVPGDLVKITLGSKIPADIRLLNVSSDLKFDRSILTGEAEAIPATVDSTDTNFLETRNVALQGTLCVSGSGEGVVVQTGDSTVFGRIAKLAGTGTGRRTTLESEILHFVIIIASMAMTLALMIVILWAAWLRPKHPGFISVPVLLIDVVSVMVAMIPEGLPMCITLSLTVIANAMRKHKVLCKSLATVETLGAVDVLLSDKTGTLTTGRMTVKQLAIGDSQMALPDAKTSISDDSTICTALDDLAAVAGVCNDATFEGEEPEADVVGDAKVNGDATDSGLLRFAQSLGSVAEYRADWKEVAKIAFNSKNKFALKLMRPTHEDKRPAGLTTVADVEPGSLALFVKGAPDVLMPRCVTLVNAEGEVVPLSEAHKEALVAAQERFARQGQRVLLIARRMVSALEFNKESAGDARYLDETLVGLNSELTILGLLALSDPPKHDTASTVATCRRAGMRFFIATGDFALTAAAIAQQIGVFTTGEPDRLASLPRDLPEDQIKPYNPDSEDDIRSLLLSGADLLVMNEVQWKQALGYEEICFARTSPQQKLQITRRLQDLGSCVAVTGDGVNDSPALKAADVGIAIGGGSEVAMEAADLVLLEDFSAIVTAILYGRMCFDNLKKVCLYLLPAGSFSELMPILLNVLIGVPQALSSFQMILICVATDVLPALSLINEQPEADVLLRRPRNRKTERLVDWKLLFHAYFFIGILESLCAMATSFYFGFVRNGIPWSDLVFAYGGIDVEPELLAECTNQAQSIYFFCLVTMQWGNLMATRTRRLSLFQQSPIGSKKTANYYLFPAMLTALGLAAFFSYLPFFQNVMLTRGVKVQHWFMPMAFGLGILTLDEIRKLLVRTYPHGLLAKMAW